MCEKVANLLCLLLSAVGGVLLYCLGAVFGGVFCERSRRAWAGPGVDVVVDCWCGRGGEVLGWNPAPKVGPKLATGGDSIT